MPKLILIKHSAVEVVPGTPPEQWNLSAKGRERCKALADRLSSHLPFRLLSSKETKAMQTAAEIAKQLQISCTSAPGLEEHDRGNVPIMQTREFISMMELFFRKHDELVLGRESADTALARFRAAIDEVLTESTEEDVAIVSHGTVIALFVAHHIAQNGFQLWRRMGLPSLVMLSLPDFQLLETVEAIA